MTRSPRTIRLAAVAVLATAMLPLSGCLYSQIPEQGTLAEPSAAPEETPSEDTPSDDTPTDGLPTTMTFADGTTLSSTSYIQWGDGLIAADGWQSVTPDNGNGSWTDGTVDGTCTAQFWQGYTSGLETVPGDDSVSSDALLGYVLGETAATVTPLASTTQLSYQFGDNPAVDARQVYGEEPDGRTWTIVARAFASAGSGVYVIIDCTGGDVDATFDDVNAHNSIMIMP
ncbi:hypothetical protein ACI3KS_13565 [Microbacterium sp. ZW T5_45]|uniref:hypothetical protein n=1 Tax=Microbacterium sp. ZW T5_45 TaxID=3378080 RepID=UPI0038548DA5